MTIRDYQNRSSISGVMGLNLYSNRLRNKGKVVEAVNIDFADTRL